MRNRDVQTRYYTVTEACDEMHVSRNTLRKLALDAEAIVKIGTRNIRVDMPKLYRYMENVNTLTDV